MLRRRQGRARLAWGSCAFETRLVVCFVCLSVCLDAFGSLLRYPPSVTILSGGYRGVYRSGGLGFVQHSGGVLGACGGQRLGWPC